MRVYPVPGGFVIAWSPVEGNLILERAVYAEQNFQFLADVTGKTFFYDKPQPHYFWYGTWYRLVLNGREIERQRVLNLPDNNLLQIAERVKKYIEVSGRPIAVLKLKAYGKHCPVCYSESMAKPTNPKCPVCYGTGWEGGYWDPIFTYSILHNEHTEGRKQIIPVIQTPQNILIVLDNTTPVAPRDIIVDLQEGGMYRVDSVQENVELGLPISQQVSATRIKEDAPEQNIKVSLADHRKSYYVSRLKSGVL